MSYDRKRKRPIELQTILHDMTRRDPGVSAGAAERRNRTACDALFVVQVYRDPAVDGADDPMIHFQTSSFDGRTLAPMKTEELFDVLVALAGHIMRNNEDADGRNARALKQKRFLLAMLTQLKLSESLGPLEKDAPAPEMPLGVSSPALRTLEEAVEGEEDTAVADTARELREMREAARELFPKLEEELSKRGPTETPAGAARGFDLVDAASLDEALDAVREPSASET